MQVEFTGYNPENVIITIDGVPLKGVTPLYNNFEVFILGMDFSEERDYSTEYILTEEGVIDNPN